MDVIAVGASHALCARTTSLVLVSIYLRALFLSLVLTSLSHNNIYECGLRNDQ